MLSTRLFHLLETSIVNISSSSFPITLALIGNSIYTITMTPTLLNISLTLGGLILVVLFYLPMFKHLIKNTKQFICYVFFWLAVLALLTSIVDYAVFSTFKTEILVKPGYSEIH